MSVDPGGTDLANYDSIMCVTPYGFPTGNRYARSDYWPYRGIAPSTVTRCGGPPPTVPAEAAPHGAALSVGTSDGGVARKPGVGVPLTAISDGTSNTLLMTEVAGRGLAGYVRGRPVAAITGLVISPSPLATAPTPIPTVGNQDDRQFARGAWADQWGTPLLRGQTVTESGDRADVNAGCGLVNVSNFAGPYSFHTGGVNVLRCDGSAGFPREDVAASAVVALITRAGGETAGPER